MRQGKGCSSEGQGSEGGAGLETQGRGTWSFVGECTIFLTVIPGHRFIHSFVHLFIHACMHSFMHSFTHTFTHTAEASSLSSVISQWL